MIVWVTIANIRAGEVHALDYGHGQRYLDHEWPHVHGHEQPTASPAHDTELRAIKVNVDPPPYSSRACQSSNTKESRDGHDLVSLEKSWQTANQLRRIPSAQHQIDVVEAHGDDYAEYLFGKGQTW
jgi:hypothetical protein